MGEIGPEAKPAIPALIQLLGDESGAIRLLHMAKALGAIGPEAKPAVPALNQL